MSRNRSRRDKRGGAQDKDVKKLKNSVRVLFRPTLTSTSIECFEATPNHANTHKGHDEASN